MQASAQTERAAWTHDSRVIAVDSLDNELGFMSRAEAHTARGVLHRAFMVVLVDDAGRIVLARRSAHKRLWPLFWADSCAGHPAPGEDIVEAAARRVEEELRCRPETLRPVGSFIYQAGYEGLGSEHELCHVLVGRVRSVEDPDPAEVAEVRSFDADRLDAIAAAEPEKFAPWLLECLTAFPSRTFVAAP